MSVTGTTSLTIAMEALAKLVASSATFRALVGAADATAALTSIHWPEADDRITYTTQTLRVTGSPTGGTFPLSFEGQAASIAYNDSAATIQTKLEALSTIGTGGATCTGGPINTTAVVVTIADASSSLKVGTSALTGGTLPTASVEVMDSPRPRAIVRSGPEHSWRRGGPGSWRDAGVLELAFEFLVPASYRPIYDNMKDSAFWFANTYGTVLDEMQDNIDAGGGTYLHVSQFDLIAGPDYPDELDPDYGSVYAVAYLCQWGVT